MSVSAMGKLDVLNLTMFVFVVLESVIGHTDLV